RRAPSRRRPAPPPHRGSVRGGRSKPAPTSTAGRPKSTPAGKMTLPPALPTGTKRVPFSPTESSSVLTSGEGGIRTRGGGLSPHAALAKRCAEDITGDSSQTSDDNPEALTRSLHDAADPGLA